MFDKTSPFYIDFPARIRAIQAEMAKEKIDLYLGSRLRTMSWTTDAFFPWRSFIVIPADGLPTAFTFVIDAARAADDSWLDEDHVLGFAPMGGQDAARRTGWRGSRHVELPAGRLPDLLRIQGV